MPKTRRDGVWLQAWWRLIYEGERELTSAQVAEKADVSERLARETLQQIPFVERVQRGRKVTYQLNQSVIEGAEFGPDS